jgi:hypothetical protein
VSLYLGLFAGYKFAHFMEEREVNINIYQYNNYYGTVSAESTSNSMYTTSITVGSELSATSGASAGTNDFAYNEWLSSDGTWNWQTATPQTTVNAPPNGSWCWCSTSGGIWSTWD